MTGDDGLLLKEDPGLGLEGNIGKAITAYLHQYGEVPNCCRVHPSVLGAVSMLPLREDQGILRIVADLRLPRHQLWIGIEEEGEPPQEACAEPA
jgi:hypothetical protein